MKSEELKKLQAPLKEKYRNEPDSAVVTLTAKGKIGEGITCKIETGKLLKEAGLHPASGGNGLYLCSGDMLLEALTACAGVTLNSVATSISVKLEDAEIIAEGDLDFRGTLAVSKDVPVGFKNIRLKFSLKTNADEEQQKTLIKLTARYCVVFQTLQKTPEISVSYNVS